MLGIMFIPAMAQTNFRHMTYQEALEVVKTGTRMSIDETALSRGELYTIITNKSAKGKKGSLFAMIRGTKAGTICDIINKLPRKVRYKCREITMDFGNNMSLIARRCFPQTIRVNDRFHLHQLVYEALQDVWIKYRWQTLEAENMAAKNLGPGYQPEILENGDTLKQLLARSRYLLYKTREKWSESQKMRARLLFERYPEIETAYRHAVNLNHVLKPDAAQQRIPGWQSGMNRWRNAR